MGDKKRKLLSANQIMRFEKRVRTTCHVLSYRDHFIYDIIVSLFYKVFEIKKIAAAYSVDKLMDDAYNTFGALHGGKKAI